MKLANPAMMNILRFNSFLFVRVTSIHIYHNPNL